MTPSPLLARVGFAAVVVLAALTVQPTAASAATVALPPANGVFDYQLGGAYTPASDVTIVDRDRTASPVSGKYNICYVNAFQTQPDESVAFAKAHPDLVVKGSNGKPLVDPGWPDEYIYDISTAAKRTELAGIVGGWIDGCATKKFQAIEADNFDSYLRSKGKLTQANNIAFATLLTQRAHAKGLAMGQKNGSDLAVVGRNQVGFDFAVVEECQFYSECDAFTSVYGAQVYEVEYSYHGESYYTDACAARGAKVSVIYRDVEVVPASDKAYVYKHC